MQLPKDFMDSAAKFAGISPERKQQILQHFASMPEGSRKKSYDQFQTNGGPDAEFVKAIFEPSARKVVPEPTAAPKPVTKANEEKA